MLEKKASIRVALGLFLVSFELVSTRSEADEPSDAPAEQGTEAEAAAENSTTPFPSSSEISFKPSYRFPNGDSRYRAEILVEPRFRYDGFSLPRRRRARPRAAGDRSRSHLGVPDGNEP